MTLGLDERGTSGDVGATAASATRAAPLVLGLGNSLLADDGVGLHLLAALGAAPASDAPPVNYVDGGTLSFALLPYLEATDRLLVVDAAHLGIFPGAVRLFEGEAMDEYLRSQRRRTVHEVGLIDLLEMARIQGSLPERRALLSVQPGVIDWGEALSPPVRAALPDAIRLATRLLARWAHA
jgi:hydrogenase maturation protease